MHSGERHFICKQCNYYFTQVGDLKKHIVKKRCCIDRTGWILRWAENSSAKQAALLIVHTHPIAAKYSPPSDENSAILCGIMDDSCCSRQIPFFSTFSRRTLSAPALSWAWSFTILLKLYFLNSVQYRQLCCLSQLYSKMSWIEYGCTPKAEVLYSVKCNALYFELWPSAANFGFDGKESEEKNTFGYFSLLSWSRCANILHQTKIFGTFELLTKGKKIRFLMLLFALS